MKKTFSVSFVAILISSLFALAADSEAYGQIRGRRSPARGQVRRIARPYALQIRAPRADDGDKVGPEYEYSRSRFGVFVAHPDSDIGPYYGWAGARIGDRIGTPGSNVGPLYEYGL